MIKVHNVITVYERDGSEAKCGSESIAVDSHWNRNSLVVLVIGEHRYAIGADDLVAAIRNAQNTGCR